MKELFFLRRRGGADELPAIRRLHKMHAVARSRRGSRARNSRAGPGPAFLPGPWQAGAGGRRSHAAREQHQHILAAVAVEIDELDGPPAWLLLILPM